MYLVLSSALPPFQVFYYLTIEESLRCLTADPLFNSLRETDRQPGQRSVFLESHGMEQINSKLNCIVKDRNLPEGSLNPVLNVNNIIIQIGEDATIAANSGTHSTNVSCIRLVCTKVVGGLQVVLARQHVGVGRLLRFDDDHLHQRTKQDTYMCVCGWGRG